MIIYSNKSGIKKDVGDNFPIYIKNHDVVDNISRCDKAILFLKKMQYREDKHYIYKYKKYKDIVVIYDKIEKEE